MKQIANGVNRDASRSAATDPIPPMPADETQHPKDPQALVQAVHKELRASFLESIPGRVAEIERCAEAIQADAPTAQSVAALQAETHRLAGTSAVYGFLNTSTVARRFNQRLRESLESGNLAVSIEIVRAFLTDLDAALQTDA